MHMKKEMEKVNTDLLSTYIYRSYIYKQPGK